MVDILNCISHFSWFYEQFTIANGLEWLSRIGIGDYWTRLIILEIIVDQISFENATPNLNGPLECSYICLQNLRGTIIRSIVDRRYQIDDGDLEATVAQAVSYLQHALTWVLQSAANMRNEGHLSLTEDNHEVPSFAQMAIRRIQDHGAPPGQLRSFEFAREMSNEEWEEWSLRVKVMVMGAKLGGLGCGPMYAQHRFVRDPDGICG
jgi:hypothetical protein